MNYNISINNGDLPSNNNTNNNNENKIIDHLIITVHGIGKHEEKWNEKIIKINQTYQNVTKITERNKNCKFIGLEWHSGVHKKTDAFIKKVTPNTIPVVRELINHTLLDILLFTSPTFSQHIYSEVGNKLNQIYRDFLAANPTFKGKVSILAHSLGSMICYDILCHQLTSISKIDSSTDSTTADYQYDSINHIDKGNIYYWRKFKEEQKLQQKLQQQQQNNDKKQRQLKKQEKQKLKQQQQLEQQQQQQQQQQPKLKDDYSSDEETESDIDEIDVEEELKNSLLSINFPKLEFDVFNLYCIGSPIGLFCTVRGHQSIDIPNCTNLYNIYDQSDPVAALLEPLIDEGFQDAGESLAPHFKKSKLVNKVQNNNNNNNVSTPSTPNSIELTTTTNVNSNSSFSSNNNINNNISNNNNNNNNNNNINNNTTTSSSTSMFSKLTSKLNSVINKNSLTTTTTNTTNTYNNNNNNSSNNNETIPNNTALQLTTQKQIPSPSSNINVLVEETEMLSFDGASSTSMKRNQSFNGSSFPSSDSEFDDESSERSEKSDRSSYNLYIDSQQLDTTKKPSLNTPNKPLPTTPSSSSSSTSTTTTSNNNINNNRKYFGGYRFDYKLKQTGVFSSFSDYSSVLNAHKSYWFSNDVMYFISERLSSNDNK
ncbi:hypothetical protein ACTFIU_005548 [Dictyostelium citrinum]